MTPRLYIKFDGKDFSEYEISEIMATLEVRITSGGKKKALQSAIAYLNSLMALSGGNE